MKPLQHSEEFAGLSLLAHRIAWNTLAAETAAYEPDEFHAEALLGLCIAFETFDPSRNIPLGGYATTIIRRRMYELLRRLRKHRRVRSLPATDFGQVSLPCRKTRDPAEALSTQELLAKVRRALPPKLYEALSLYYLEGLTLEEIGRRSGHTRQWAHLRIERAIRFARAALPEYVQRN
jgi:RNA polymerase sigma factor (sigma-70 family)